MKANQIDHYGLTHTVRER